MHYLSPEQIAERFGVPLSTVYNWRTKGYGPRGIRIGRHIRYPSTELERWEREQFDSAGVA